MSLWNKDEMLQIRSLSSMVDPPCAGFSQLQPLSPLTLFPKRRKGWIPITLMTAMMMLMKPGGEAQWGSRCSGGGENRKCVNKKGANIKGANIIEKNRTGDKPGVGANIKGAHKKG